MLLSRDLKRNPAAVRWVALLVLIMRVVDITWTIGPVFRRGVEPALARLRRGVCDGRACGSRCSGATWPGVRSFRRTTRTSRKQWLMADTKHVHGAAPIEGDGVSYSGIVWFVVILTVTTVACQLIVWGAFELMEWRVDRGDAARAPLAAERARPAIDRGRVDDQHAGIAAAGAARHRADRASASIARTRRRACPRTDGSIAAPARCGFRSIARRRCSSSAGCRHGRARLRPLLPARSSSGGSGRASAGPGTWSRWTLRTR